MQPNTPRHLEKHLDNSKALDFDGIRWDEIKAHPLSDDEVFILTYFMDVEANTIIYLKELLSTPVAFDPEVQAFLCTWVYEEFFHGHALRRFLTEYGVDLSTSRIADVQQSKSLWHHIRLLGQTAISKLAGRHFIGVHMAWGAANELLTVEGYARIAEKTKHPVLRELLGRIMKDERRHFAFYFKEAQRRLEEKPARRLTSTLLRRFFEPVGADIRDLDSVDKVALLLFDDAAGLDVIARCDEKIGQLPGLEDFHVFSRVVERTRARHPELVRATSPSPSLSAMAPA
jgi:hypothetical protein